MKVIISRKLDLSIKYNLIDKKYIPLIDNIGLCCDNCGKLISNIATIRGNNQTYNIGFDCLDTILLNNSILDGLSLDDYNKAKIMLPKIIRQAKKLKEVINNNSFISGLIFEKQTYKSDFYPFHYEINGQQSRNNDYIKAKDVEFNLLIETFKNIFPKLNISIK